MLKRILLADDHQVVILGIRKILESSPRHRVVGEAANATDLLYEAKRLAPHIIITDYNMPSGEGRADGMALIGSLRRTFPSVQILIHTMITSPVIVAGLYEMGASGVLFKSGGLEQIPAALDALDRGKIYRAPQESNDGVGASESLEASARIARLSQRELEVLRHFLAGKSVSDISRIMSRSIKTISTHKISAMHKLEVATDHELVMFGVNYDVLK
ncbi:response regulator [Stenotrophomonas geniculata]|uniref:response regulator n=1 Tax=Stenotrophomonas geniculata TaxID=86188 RepID=UPI003AAD4EE6